MFANHAISARAGIKEGWRKLAPSSLLNDSLGVTFFQFKTDNGSDANLIVIDLNNEQVTLKPFFNFTKGTTSDAAKRLKAVAAANGGYFNLSDGVSASYVCIDKVNQCSPRNNKALVDNPKLFSYLPAIFARSEVRFLHAINSRSKPALTAVIASHEAPIPTGYEIIHSLQAGPRLLPNLTAKEEAFVRTDSQGNTVDSIGCYRPAARTAIGITADNHVLLLCVAGKGQDEFSSGISLPDLANLMQNLGCREAINFDGGTSTTMVIASQSHTVNHSPSPEPSYTQVCGKTPEKLVKSGLAVIEYDKGTWKKRYDQKNR
jgi:hypothetical protein